MTKQPEQPANALWGGRFAGSSDDLMQNINASIDVDRRFAEQDIVGSLAHVAMLGAVGIIDARETAQIEQGLRAVREEIRAGNMAFCAEKEDIHMHVESRLTELIGPVAGKLHTARSRNDQVATDFRLWLVADLREKTDQIRSLQKALVSQAERFSNTILPGLTHLQTAQPITFGHHLLAYVEMLDRDASRMDDASKRTNECPLGAAALAGTAFAIDRDQTAKALGFSRPMANSLDAVSSRDFALEALSAASICAIHLSRLADEMVYWASTGIGFISFTDRFSTGSSIMPQKRNPDAAELVRAKSGRIAGALQALLLVMKGLPLAYSKDMQEDKQPVFDAMDTLSLCLQVMGGMVLDMQIHHKPMLAAASGGFATATDLADWLVREAGKTFREAHHCTGKVVRLAEQKNCDLAALSLHDLQSVEPAITKAVFSVLQVEASVKSRNSYGGTAPKQVMYQVEKWKERLT